MRIEASKLFADKAGGGEICLADGADRMPFSYVGKLVDVTGAADGARSMVQIVTPCLETSMSKSEFVRLKEKPNQLSRAFFDVGLPMPKVEQPGSVSKALSLLTGNTGPNLYTRLETAAKSAASKFALK